ncbi:hypothetical protein [Litorivita pollutaquae]|nr:hypothetical protein [Litorivita pollutaquae]
MKKQSRFIKSVVETSKSEMPALPWARGKARAAMIARRSATPDKVKRA